MISDVDEYVSDVHRELRRHGVLGDRIIEEVRGHLLDAVEAGQRQGLPSEAAVENAIRQCGPPAVIARHFAAEKGRAMQKLLLTVSVTLGVLIGYLDSRPSWDDTGVTAGLLFISAAIIGALGPRRPWLWGLCLGIWIPIFGLTHGLNYGSLLALAIALIGAYAGAGLRRVLSAA